MPKYYCETGDFRTIVIADDYDTAVDIAIQKLIVEEQECSIIMSISETGYDLRKCKFVSMIPFLKRAGIELPPICDVINRACELLGKDPKDLDQHFKDWLLEDYGAD